MTSDRDGYGGGREPRGYMDRPSGGSYRESYDGYGKIWLDQCSTNKSCTNNQPNHGSDNCTPRSQDAAVFPQTYGCGISGSVIKVFFPSQSSSPKIEFLHFNVYYWHLNWKGNFIVSTPTKPILSLHLAYRLTQAICRSKAECRPENLQP